MVVVSHDNDQYLALVRVNHSLPWQMVQLFRSMLMLMQKKYLRNITKPLKKVDQLLEEAI